MPNSSDVTSDDDLNARQLAAMDALWRAERADEVSSEEAREIESVIRRGHPYGARKRLTVARRRRQTEPE